MRFPPGRPKPAQEGTWRIRDSAHSLFTTADWGSQCTGGTCTEGHGAHADGHALLLRAPHNRPKPMERKIKPPSQTDDSARPYRDTKLRPSKTGAKSSQQFRSSSRTKVSRSSIRRWLPI